MDDFLRFFNEKKNYFPMRLSIFYSKNSDWNILVYKKGCIAEYPDSKRDEQGNVILAEVQDCDMELAFAKAHVQLKEWLSEFEGGY